MNKVGATKQKRQSPQKVLLEQNENLRASIHQFQSPHPPRLFDETHEASRPGAVGGYYQGKLPGAFTLLISAIRRAMFHRLYILSLLLDARPPVADTIKVVNQRLRMQASLTPALEPVWF